MLITKTNPVGIDFMLQKFQTFLHDELMVKWGLNPAIAAQDKLFECYGRCARNKTESGYVAEILTSGNDYKEVYWNDTINAISFFGISGSETYNIGETVPVHLVFFVDLKKLKPTITHRADEEVRKDVQLLAEKGMFGFRYISTELWIENVLKEYNGSYKSSQLQKLDMQPVHCFRLNFELQYNKNNC
jgi:hypothetical protein